MLIFRIALFVTMVSLCHGKAFGDTLRVVSLDMCADQYAAALLPKRAILAVSMQSQLPESFFSKQLKGVRRSKGNLETLLYLKPDAVLRTWGGDAKLIKILKDNGIKIININDVSNLSDAKYEFIRVANQLQASQLIISEINLLHKSLDRARHIGKNRSILYYTPSGYSAGHDTWVGALLNSMGFRLIGSGTGYYPLSPEYFISLRPDVYGLGFYSDRFGATHTPGRLGIIKDRLKQKPNINLSGAALACSAWYGSEALLNGGKRL